MKKAVAGIMASGIVAVSGSAAVDHSIDPYTQQGTQLEIQHASTLPEAGAVKLSADTEKPKISLSKWGGEVNLGVTYTGIKAKGGRPLFSKKVEWKGAKQTMEAVPLDATAGLEDGGFEININLDSKPASNIFTFQLDNWENLDFFYQPALTPQDIAEGASMPDNVVGSYAVYYKDHANHIEGQTNYATGKAYHIYRPLVTDADGQTTWADLSYMDGVLTVTVPQSFLDGGAYPVVVDPTFGYTTAGASEFNDASAQCSLRTAQLVSSYTAATGDSVTSISAYTYASSTSVFNVDIYSISAGVPANRLGDGTIQISVGTSKNWYSTAALSLAMVSGTTYGSAWSIPNPPAVARSIFFDAGSAPGRVVTTDAVCATGTTMPTSFGAVGADSGRHYSIYATYTAGAATAINPAKPPTINNGSIKLNNGHVIIKY